MTDNTKERLQDCYDRIVENTENPDIINYTKEHDKLQFGLDLLEYILEGWQDNPIDYHFRDAY